MATKSSMRQRLILRIWLFGIICLCGSIARGQDKAKDFANHPVLVVGAGGHMGQVRALAFSDDETTLFSAGEDKVVRIWDLRSTPPSLGKTIRPPIWRGSAGAIYAMTISPTDATGRRIIAVAGQGVSSMRGEIKLYQHPGRVDRPFGDPIGELAATEGETPLAATGHIDAVAAMAFDPTGSILASGSVDRTIRLWDVAQRKQLAILRADDQGPVNVVAFRNGGKELISGGDDGVVRLWDVDNRRSIARWPALADPNPVPASKIKAMTLSPDGHWLVIGRENGFLIRFDMSLPDWYARGVVALHNPHDFNPMTGSVLAVAFGPDDALATSIVSRAIVQGQLPSLACDVVIRGVVDNVIRQTIFSSSATPPNPTTNHVRALAFSPTGKSLAIAGFDDQRIVLKTLDAPTVEIGGQGQSLWDVKFAEVGPPGGTETVVAFRGERDGLADYTGYALRTRQTLWLKPTEVSADLTVYDGMTVNALSNSKLQVVRNGQSVFQIELSNTDGRWWAHTFIPPGPGHPRACVAVACEAGVAIYRIDDRVRCRFVAGHGGPVYSLAVSADRRWLASGSRDQTLGLTTLAGCDTVAPLGAEFDIRDDKLVVNGVTSHGFAEAAGLLKDDVIEEAALNGARVTAHEFVDRIANVPPNIWVQFGIRPRVGEMRKVSAQKGRPSVVVGTTKRDRPSLKLFVAKSGEWVFWTPRGYYDTSVEGDKLFLGWHTNHAEMGRTGPSDYVPITTYEKALRQRKADPANFLDRLLDTADETIAFGEARGDDPLAIVSAGPPSLVARLVDNGTVVRGLDGRVIRPGEPIPDRATAMGPIAVKWEVETRKGEALGVFRSDRDGRPLPRGDRVDNAAEGKSAIVQVYEELRGDSKIVATAENAAGVVRQTFLDVAFEVPERPVNKQTSSRVIAFAPEFGSDGPPAIRFAQDDARDLDRFFLRHAVTESGRAYEEAKSVDHELAGPRATRERLLECIEEMTGAQLGQNDTVFVVVESHLLTIGNELKIATSDGTISANEVADRLGSLTRQGCTVILILDRARTALESSKPTELVDWIRRLQNQENVIVVKKSERGPEPSRLKQRLLTEAIITVKSANKDRVMPLFEFREQLNKNVKALSLQREFGDCYLPDSVPSRKLLDLKASPRPE